MNDEERRRALAGFLRTRRERLAPADVGLPSGLRRRTPGLRREEVAQLANVGTSWYISLEQGRDIHPSEQVLESIALALRLTPDERRHLFLLAEQYLPPHPFEEKVDPALQRVVDDLDPTPAYVMGRRWDYLAWNRAADVVFRITQATPPHERNLLWRFFTGSSSRERYQNWEEIARGMLAEFRADSTRYPGDASFEELIKDLKRASPEFCLWWPQHEARKSLDGRKEIEHSTLGHLEFQHITLQVPSNPDVKIMIYTSLPEVKAKLAQFLACQPIIALPLA